MEKQVLPTQSSHTHREQCEQSEQREQSDHRDTNNVAQYFHNFDDSQESEAQ